jgi:hypothetical protein
MDIAITLPHSDKPMMKLIASLALFLTFQGCQRNDSDTYESESYRDPNSTQTEDSETPRLVDGTYSCEASNPEQDYGPYNLECEKNGDEITVYFPNGGYIVNDIDDTEGDGSGEWTVDSTHAEDGESWQIDIQE